MRWHPRRHRRTAGAHRAIGLLGNDDVYVHLALAGPAAILAGKSAASRARSSHFGIADDFAALGFPGRRLDYLVNQSAIFFLIGVRRATFLIDGSRRIRDAVLADFMIGRHSDFVRKAILLHATSP